MNTKLYMENLMGGNHMYVNGGADENNTKMDPKEIGCETVGLI
jgi:hypothetical protein